MIPDKSNACWRELASGQKSIQTQALGLQMMLKRMHRALSAAPGEATLQAAAGEIHEFFVKYEKILANEIKSL